MELTAAIENPVDELQDFERVVQLETGILSG
jgi:hypothetical protein